MNMFKNAPGLPRNILKNDAAYRQRLIGRLVTIPEISGHVYVSMHECWIDSGPGDYPRRGYPGERARWTIFSPHDDMSRVYHSDDAETGLLVDFVYYPVSICWIVLLNEKTYRVDEDLLYFGVEFQ